MLRTVEFSSGLRVYVSESPIPKDCPRADAVNLPLSLPLPQQSNCFSADFQAFSIWGKVLVISLSFTPRDLLRYISPFFKITFKDVLIK